MMAERLPEEELAQSSQRGRPTSEVDPEEVKFLLSKGFTKTKIASMLQISRRTLYNKISVWGEANFQKYSTISDADLDLKVQSVKVTHPNDGEIMLAGHLRSQGIHVPRAKLRASMPMMCSFQNDTYVICHVIITFTTCDHVFDHDCD